MTDRCILPPPAPPLSRAAHTQQPGLRFRQRVSGVGQLGAAESQHSGFSLRLYLKGKSLAPPWAPLTSWPAPSGLLGSHRPALDAAAHRPACLIESPYSSFLSVTKGPKKPATRWCDLDISEMKVGGGGDRGTRRWREEGLDAGSPPPPPAVTPTPSGSVPNLG